ncbi:prolyl-tRNA synthetase associated domain-containing protein [Roseovarius atlanticus]|uniref:prolyl-tRNA synthetase associated domain-containing protein n=1 Tax=Roseovarius atlanticus TaxID=1641875 RepID=UPI001C946727|nr:prolyl-tRNA synthetase associated domain-containing protein [Roseovarius atlanticus]MBY5986786.1 prolyl-tRNA synthetase associated domain-containing protein [Roseovarius atlanticus]MBY6125426.1 prolyl-tRNA synthetase associated domain-containing protein [Roseovarius atlanticus]MBY6150113.1 prolyl-tRNA synthetase associated domain-containing protein [Roseovarius atlanticus]
MVDATSAFQDSLPVSSDDLLAQMRAAGVEFELYGHIPLRTVEDAKTVQGGAVPGGPGRIDIKNFYLRDRKKRNHLVVLEQDREVDLKALGAQMGVAGLSFGSAERLMEFLGVRPGAVSPLAMVNGAGTGVQLWMDAAVKAADFVHAHPLVNDRTVAIRPGDLVSLLAGWGADISWLEP